MSLEPRPRGGCGELGIVAQELMQPRMDVEPRADRLEDDRSPGGRQLAARRRDAEQQPVGTNGAIERVGQASDERDVVTGDRLVHVATDHRRIEDRDDVVPAVADDAGRGLGVVDAVPFGEDDETARLGRQHRGSLRNRSATVGEAGAPGPYLWAARYCSYRRSSRAASSRIVPVRRPVARGSRPPSHANGERPIPPGWHRCNRPSEPRAEGVRSA